MTATIHDDESVGVKLSTLIVETQKIDNIETPLHQQRKLMASPAIAVRYIKLQVTAAEYAMVGFAGIHIYGINNATEVVQLSASVVNHSASVVSQDGCWEGSATGDTWVIFDLGVSQEVTSVDLVRTDSCGTASQTVSLSFLSLPTQLQTVYSVNFDKRFNSAVENISASQCYQADW